jgi:phosphoglycolate phosphatase-like HAD superfamily hydrolase
MKKIVIFDFDGTIADTFPIASKIFKKVIKEYGYEDITDKDIQKLREMNPIQIITHFKFPPWKVPGLINQVRDNLSKHVNKIKPFKGIKDLLYEFKKKGIKFGIVTSNNKKTVDEFLLLNIFPDFDFIEAEPNIFKKGSHLKKVVKKYKFKRKNAIYVGDEVRDIEASRDAGVDVIAVTWGYNKKEVLLENKPTYIANTPKEIILHIL